ncbi:CHAD domain-containing protein [Sphingomonas sp. R86520]|uniref:CHAD domain-containing protein n=1 Tax=Sphingomonas sp. R86520 TaxID=3093859 RepID=UPI0036D31C64
MAEALRSPAITVIEPDLSTAAAFRIILDSKLIQIKTNIGPTLGGNPEGLHRLRIALRGARAVLQLFSPMMPVAGMASLDRDLQRVCRICGVGRDWDVFCLETLPAARLARPSVASPALLDAAQTHRAASHRAVTGALQGARFTLLLDRLAILSRAKHRSSPHYRDACFFRSIAISAPVLLDRMARRTAKRGRHVRRLSARMLHTYRKSLDRLFDDTGSFTRTFATGDVETYRTHCMALQEILGLANDAAVTKQLVAELKSDGRADCATSVEALERWNRHRRRSALMDLKRSHDVFRRTRRFWASAPHDRGRDRPSR